MFKHSLALLMVAAIAFTSACSKEQAPTLTEAQQKERLEKIPTDTGSKNKTTVEESKIAATETEKKEEAAVADAEANGGTIDWSFGINWSAIFTYASDIAYKYLKFVLTQVQVSDTLGSVQGLDKAQNCVQIGLMVFTGNTHVDWGKNTCPSSPRVIRAENLIQTLEYRPTVNAKSEPIYELSVDDIAVGSMNRTSLFGLINIPGEVLHLCDGAYAPLCEISKENGALTGITLKVH